MRARQRRRRGGKIRITIRRRTGRTIVKNPTQQHHIGLFTLHINTHRTAPSPLQNVTLYKLRVGRRQPQFFVCPKQHSCKAVCWQLAVKAAPIHSNKGYVSSSSSILCYLYSIVMYVNIHSFVYIYTYSVYIYMQLVYVSLEIKGPPARANLPPITRQTKQLPERFQCGHLEPSNLLPRHENRLGSDREPATLGFRTGCFSNVFWFVVQLTSKYGTVSLQTLLIKPCPVEMQCGFPTLGRYLHGASHARRSRLHPEIRRTPPTTKQLWFMTKWVVHVEARPHQTH